VSALYSHPEFPANRKCVELLQRELKVNVAEKDWRRHLNTANIVKYARKITKKHLSGQPVSFTDFFSHLLADTLMPTVSYLHYRRR
jgi:phospholipase A2